VFLPVVHTFHWFNFQRKLLGLKKESQKNVADPFFRKKLFNPRMLVRAHADFKHTRQQHC